MMMVRHYNVIILWYFKLQWYKNSLCLLQYFIPLVIISGAYIRYFHHQRNIDQVFSSSVGHISGIFIISGTYIRYFHHRRNIYQVFSSSAEHISGIFIISRAYIRYSMNVPLKCTIFSNMYTLDSFLCELYVGSKYGNWSATKSTDLTFSVVFVNSC